MNLGRGAVALAAVLAAALALRLWGIGYGLPWLFYFHDEPQVVLRALRFGTGDLNPHFFIWPGTLMMWIAFLSYGALFAVGRLAGWWAGREGFAAAYFQDPTAFYVLARLQSVVLGTLTVWLAFALGRSAYSPAVGWAAAVGLAINALHAHYSHLAHPVVAMTAFTTLGLWAAHRLATGGTARHLLLGALAAGLGASAQYHAGLLAIPLGLAVVWRALDAAGADRVRWLSLGLGAAALAAAVFLVVSPFVVLDHATFRADLAWITAKTSGDLDAGGHRMTDGLVAFVRRCLLPGLGWPLAAAALAGAVLAIARRTRADLLLLAFVAAYFLLTSRAAVLNDRYAIPLVVPALLLGARVVESALHRLRGGAGVIWKVPAATALLCLPSAIELIETDHTMTRPDTRVEALRWFEDHVPANERVVIDMLRFWNSASPPLAENAERTRERLAEIERGVSGAGHGAAYLEFFEYRLRHPHQPAYYLRSTVMGEETRPLAEYRRDGFRWAVVSEEARGPAEARAARGDTAAAAYYRALEREAERVARFLPERWRRRGPEIRIYRL